MGPIRGWPQQKVKISRILPCSKRMAALPEARLLFARGASIWLGIGNDA
jgi:hypothetical protein